MRTSELAAAMAAAGAPIDAILIALRAIEERDEAIDAKRAVERNRKRKQREKAAENDGTITGQSRDASGTVPEKPSLSPSPLSSPQTPLLTPRPHTHPDNNTRARKGTRLPADWQPLEFSKGSKSRKIVVGWSHDEMLGHLEHFTAHHRARGTKFKDWQGAWSTWVLNSDKFGRKANGNGNRKVNGKSIDGRSSLARAIDEGLDWIDQSQASVS